MDKGWTILVTLIAALIVLLLAFAGYVSYEQHRALCPQQNPNCGAPPGTPHS